MGEGKSLLRPEGKKKRRRTFRRTLGKSNRWGKREKRGHRFFPRKKKERSSSSKGRTVEDTGGREKNNQEEPDSPHPATRRKGMNPYL